MHPLICEDREKGKGKREKGKGKRGIKIQLQR